MSFFDFADLPRSHFKLDSIRRYRGLSYNCSHVPHVSTSRPSPSRRDSAIVTSAKSFESRTPSRPVTKNPIMAIKLEPFTPTDIPSAIALHSSITKEPASEAREYEWQLAVVNPYAKIVKATFNGDLIGAAGFLTHETLGLQWTSPERKAWAGSAEKELEERLEEAREEVLHGDYDLWHIYLSFLAPKHRDNSAWSDMVTWGLEQADKVERRVYVQASASEKAMYEKLGFRTKNIVPLLEGDRYLMLRRA